MIYGHRFIFPDEPLLNHLHRDAYAESSSSHNKAVQVEEDPDCPYETLYPLVTKSLQLSGQRGRYRSLLPFEKADKDFSWVLEIKDVLTLIWDASEEKIIYVKGKEYTPHRLLFWVFHTFFPIVLELRKKYHILHVGSVEINGKPILFSAPSFGGKSTMTDYFIRKGHTMLSDDSLAIEKKKDHYYAIASYPYHRPYRKLETLGDYVTNYTKEAKLLHAVYVLERAEADAEVQIERLTGIEKFKAFHFTNFIDFAFNKQSRFIFFSEMAKKIPMYRVKVPWDIKRLDEVYQKVLANSLP